MQIHFATNGRNGRSNQLANQLAATTGQNNRSKKQVKTTGRNNRSKQPAKTTGPTRAKPLVHAVKRGPTKQPKPRAQPAARRDLQHPPDLLQLQPAAAAAAGRPGGRREAAGGEVAEVDEEGEEHERPGQQGDALP